MELRINGVQINLSRPVQKPLPITISEAVLADMVIGDGFRKTPTLDMTIGSGFRRNSGAELKLYLSCFKSTSISGCRDGGLQAGVRGRAAHHPQSPSSGRREVLRTRYVFRVHLY